MIKKTPLLIAFLVLSLLIHLSLTQNDDSFQPVIQLNNNQNINNQEQFNTLNANSQSQQQPQNDQQLSSINSNIQQEQKQIPIQPRIPFAFNYQNFVLYKYEVGFIILILLYVIHYNWGKSTNADIIEKFYKATHKILNENFQHIGFSQKNGQDPFIAQSAHQILFYATGRDNIDSMEMSFTLRKRQDLFYSYLYEIIYPDKDLVTIDIPVKSQVMVCFCLANKKGLKGLSQNSMDLKLLCGNFELQSLNPYYQVLGQSGQTIDQVFEPYIVKKINDMKGLLVSIHYTDQKLFSQSQGHLRVVLNASHKKTQLYQTTLEMILNIADKMANLKLSSSAKQKAVKLRQALNASKEKQEMQRHKEQLKKKKEEKLRQQQAWLRSLPPQKQKREDEKRKKKQMNKMMKGKVMKTM